MQRKYKHVNQGSVTFNFNQGLNTNLNPMDIEDNELQQLDNWIYNPKTNLLEVAPGRRTVLTASGTITSMFFNPSNNSFIYTIGTSVYKTVS